MNNDFLTSPRKSRGEHNAKKDLTEENRQILLALPKE
jgi:hypothetical protein